MNCSKCPVGFPGPSRAFRTATMSKRQPRGLASLSHVQIKSRHICSAATAGANHASHKSLQDLETILQVRSTQKLVPAVS